MATKLSKAQLAVIDRIGGGERIEKSWMGRTYHGNNHKAVPLTTVMVLVNGGYIKRTDVVTHFRHYHVLTLTDAGRDLYAARHAPAEQPTGLLDGLNDFLAALTVYVAKMIETANRTNRFTADICDYRAAWWLDHAQQQFAKHNLYHYRVALRRSQYYQRGAALARETGRKVMQVNAGREYNEDWRATEPTPGALLKGSNIDPDDYEYELDYDAGIIAGTWPNNG